MECNIRNVFHALLLVLYFFSVKSEKTNHRFVPSNYKLEIFTSKVHFQDSTEEMKYSGVVTIDFTKIGTSPNGEDLKITLDIGPKTTITKHTLKGDNETLNYTVVQQNGKFVITVPKEKNNVKNFQLNLTFENPFGNDMTGFYRSSYKEKVDNEEKTRWLLTTHFEPIYARNAFPCFDQPDLKATFDIEITVPEDIKTVLSNAPLNKTEKNQDGTVKFIFNKTKYPMSTYLVAFTASNLYGTEEKVILKDQKLRTYGRKELIQIGDAAVAQNTAKGALELLSNYLSESYSFGKIDQIGIPDFSAGAMENWGHISFREKSLFVNISTPQSVRQANALTIIHELVHQWFGNLVTLESWDYIWLNEAFANYLEYVIGSKITDPKNWELMKQILVNEVHLRAFETDGLKSSTPLNYKIPNENLIVSSFNDIPYSKGAAVLRMWHYQLGDENFQKALQDYIKDRKCNNSNPYHLAKVLGKYNLEEKVFKSWTDQAGYPVVELIKVNSTHYNFTQNRFFWENEKTDTVYSVPISYSTDKDLTFNTTVKSWLGRESETVKKDWKWIVVNNLQAGYYRVNYDEENWMALSNAMMSQNYSKIPDLNRAQIVNDIFSLARSLQKNYVNYSTAFKLSKYLKNETSYIAWKTALNAFDFLRIKLHNEKVYSKFQDYVFSIAKSHYKGLDQDKLGHIEQLKNVEISRLLCSLGYKACVDDAGKLYQNKKFKEYVNTEEIILCTVIANNNSKVWEDVFKIYEQEEKSSVKLMYISALGCSSNQTVISGFLNKTLEANSKIRKQDLKYVLSSVYNGNMLNIETALKFIKENFEKIATQYGGLDPLGGALVGIAKKLKTEQQLKTLEELVQKIKANPNAASISNAENAINIAKSNIKWVENRMKQIDSYFNSGSLLSYSFALLLLCLISVFQF